MMFVAAHEMNAQISSTWKGGTPGHKTDWDTPSNWSNNRVPDEFTDVTILWDYTLQGNYPIIKHPEFEAHSIFVEDGAKLNYSFRSDMIIHHVNDGAIGSNQNMAGRKSRNKDKTIVCKM